MPDTKRDDVRLTRSGRKSHAKIPGAKRGPVPMVGPKKSDMRPPKRHTRPPAEVVNGLRVTTTDDVKQVIAYMAENQLSLKQACVQMMFSYHIVAQRIMENPELKAMDSEARSQYLRAKVQDMERIALKTKDVQRARLLCDNIKWEASRVLRHEFGDHVTVAGDKENPFVMQLVDNAEQIIKRIRGRTFENGEGDAPGA